ncbi:MAG: diguanylate cyclase [Methylococcales bacterium]|nr:diguanylate cyclase [Methylococcales bacterium]
MSKELQQIKKLRTSVRNALVNKANFLQLIPVTAIKLLKLTADEDSDIQDLSKVIETEPALATQILKTVNSSQFNFSRPINSVQRAVSILGFSNLRHTAIKLLFYNKLIARPTGQSFNLLYFWQHSLFVATLSREIAIKLNHPDPDILYTAGLLHDIGKLVLESHGKLSYSEFISTNANITNSTLNNELIFFGISHEQIGYITCLDLQLPEIITSVVANHNDDSDNPIEFKQENAIVSFANYLAGIQGLGSFSQELPSVLPKTVTDIIDIKNIEIESLFHHVDKEMQETSQFYSIQFPTLDQLRARLIETSIQYNYSKTQHLPIDTKDNTKPISLLSSLTIPHQSLNPEIFIPKTLRAIHDNFNVDRVFMLSMSSKNRSLRSQHCWPQNDPTSHLDQSLDINVDTLTGDLLTCLRTRHAAIISTREFKNRSLLNQIGVTEFIAIPILRNKRLCAILYADNKFSKTPLTTESLPQIAPIAKELGSALYNARCFELEKNRAEIDSLTGLSNKRMITDFLKNLFSNEEADLKRVSVGFLDIDHFKKLNDDCGHQLGDEALIIVADILRRLTRDGDFVGRYGGEEFIFILPDCTQTEAQQYAERIRAEIEAKGIKYKNKFKTNKLTASIGIAMYQSSYKNYSELIAIADKAMYQAKNGGRNNVSSIPINNKNNYKVVSINSAHHKRDNLEFALS